MNKSVFLFGLVILSSIFLSGCTQNQLQSNSSVTNQSASPLLNNQIPDQVNSSQSGWETFSNRDFSFDYPAGMNVSQSMEQYPHLGALYFEDNSSMRSILFVVMINNTMTGATGTEDPNMFVQSILEADSVSNNDLISAADTKGPISNYTSPNGIVTAEMSFVYATTNPLSNQTVYGDALDFYTPNNLGIYAVRILSINQSDTNMMKSRFLSSFKTK